MTASVKFDLGIRCDYFLSMAGGRAEPLRDVFLGVKGSKIAEVSPWEQARRLQCREFFDARDQVVLPGFVNGHTHLAMTLFRGLEDDLPFQQWLFDRIVPLEAALVDPEFVRIGTELAALECIRFGVTTVNDMYFFADTIAEVLDRAGLRAKVSQIFGAIPFPEDRVVGTDKVQLFRRLHEKYLRNERVDIVLGPHAVYTCNDEILKDVARLSSESRVPIHIHLSETRAEVEGWKERTGKSPVRYLEDLGVLSERAVGAHCVHLDSEDIALMEKRRAAIVHNPDSNLKLGSGIAPVAEYLKRGLRVSLGTDGSASNNDLSLFGVMDLATKLQKMACSDNTAMVAEQALRLATIGGAEALGMSDQIGSLEVGKCADLICVSLKHPHLQPVHNVISHLVYSAQGLEVDTVICHGRVLLKAGVHQTMDAERIYSDAEEMRKKTSVTLGELKETQRGKK